MGINYVNYFHYMIWLIKYFDPFIFSFCYTYSHIFPHHIRHIYGNFKVHRNVHELLFNDCRRLNVCRSKLLRKAHPNKMKLISFRKSATTERYVYMTLVMKFMTYFSLFDENTDPFLFWLGTLSTNLANQIFVLVFQ